MSAKILYWNDEAMECNRIDFSGGSGEMPENGGPTLSSRALALAHLAMNDAYFSIYGGHTYLSYLPIAPGLDAETAAVAAMHEALLRLFPRQSARLQRRWSAYVSQYGIGPTASLDHGRRVARDVLHHRKDDKVKPEPYAPQARTDHRSDPTHPGQDAHGVQYGANPPLLVRAPYPSIAPVPLGDLPRATQEVRELGGESHANTTRRTPDQTVQALCWAYDGVNQIGTPPRLYNQVARAVIAAHGNPNDPTECVRVLALVNAAMGDAGILAWAEKYRYRFYRPVIGVREADPSMGPGATPAAALTGAHCDPTWLPLGAPQSNTLDAPFTPPFPAYPSGHATFGAAAFQSLRLYYRAKLGKTWGEREADDLAFELVSDELNGSTFDRTGVRPRHVRKFDSLWTAMRENAYSRVLLGVHWSFDAFAENDPKYGQRIGGVPLGLAIAEDIADRWK